MWNEWAYKQFCANQSVQSSIKDIKILWRNPNQEYLVILAYHACFFCQRIKLDKYCYTEADNRPLTIGLHLINSAPTEIETHLFCLMIFTIIDKYMYVYNRSVFIFYRDFKKKIFGSKFTWMAILLISVLEVLENPLTESCATWSSIAARYCTSKWFPLVSPVLPT